MHVLMLAQGEGGSSSSWLIPLVVGGLILIFVVFAVIMLRRYRKVSPNEALIISGRSRVIGGRKVGFRIVTGGATFVLPIFEEAKVLSLELMTIDVKTPNVYSVTGVPVKVDGVAQIKVKGEESAIATASEQFLDKSQGQISSIAHQTLEGHLRAIIGKMTVEELYRDRVKFAQNVQSESAGDFANMGMEIVSFTIREVQDDQGYLDALGKPRLAQVKRDAQIGHAEAERDATIKSSEAHQAGQEARYKAETRVAEAQQSYEIQRAQYQANVNREKAASDLAYDLQKFKTAKDVKVEEMNVLEVERERQIEIKEKELQASVHRPAEAEKYRLQQIADGQKYSTIADAEAKALSAQNIGRGEAESVKARGLGQAEATRAQGLAEAEVIAAKGQAEAEAMRKKAEAWKAYNEAAIAQMFIEKMPELARAIAEPLARMDKITVISNGGDGGTGASKVTRDIVDIVAQLPPVLEGVSGVKLADLISKVPGLGQAKKEKEK